MKKIIQALFLLCIFFVYSCNNNKNENRELVYDFENSQISGIYTPISKIKVNGVYKHFIIDSGANMSMIDESYYERNEKDFQFIKELDMTLSGVSGDKDVKAKYIVAELGDSIKIKHQFITSNLQGVIYNIRESIGIDIIGIIGADYLNKYDFCIDFYNKAVYRNQAELDSILNLNSMK